jgi:putative regulator of septum formation
MVAPTGVNEGTPQEPVAAEPPGPVTAGLAQAEAAAEDPAGPAADLGEPPVSPGEPPARVEEPAASLGEPPASLREPAADHEETAPAKAEPAGSAATDPVHADVVPADVVPAQAAPVRAADAEAGPARAGTVPAGAVPAGTVPAEAATEEAAAAELAGAGEPGLADGQEDRAGDAQEAAEPQEAAEAQEASRDVGPLAVVGIIVGVIALVGVAAGVLAMVTHGFKPKTVITYRPAAVFGLRPGQCVNAGPNSLSFTLVSCASPHDAEVFARFSLPAAAWPGSAAVRREAGDGCASRLNGYLNPQLASIGLTQEYVYPNRAAWEASQRTVVCEVSSGNGRLTGSVRAKT